MKILVIPDVHLRAGMFVCAAEKLDAGLADKAVCLMDLPDDWGMERRLDLYDSVFDAAVRFHEKYPDTLWCKGNHDMSYIWEYGESGFSAFAIPVAKAGFNRLERVAGENMQFVHRVDKVLFSHGGLLRDFVLDYVDDDIYQDVPKALSYINRLDGTAMWSSYSPIWHRPNQSALRMYKPSCFLQVVGHTPVRDLRIVDNVLMCDTFSTYPNRDPIGPAEFVVVDTEERTFETVPSGYQYEF